MSEQDASTTGSAVESTDGAATTEAPATEVASEKPHEGETALGDAGKKALDAMKAERNQYRDDMKALRAEFDAFKAKAEGKEQEFAAQQEAQRVKDEALAAANERILKAEVRAQAAGKFNDPQDALRFLDLSEFEVDSDGNVKGDLGAALDDLIKTKPYLAVQDGKRFQGDPDAGTRKEARPSQLTKSDLERMSPEEINVARKEGRLNDLMGIK